MSLRRIATTRRFVQAALLAGILLIPFLTINGNPALRMDIGQRTLFLAGAAVRIDQFYLVLLSALAMVAGFLLLTVVLGRVWCGWLCPQTVLNDLADLLPAVLQPRLPEPIAKLAAHLFALLLATAVSLNLFCWFMPPAEVVRSLIAFPTHPVVAFSFSFITIAMYLNLILIKRAFCRSYCPYGRFQAALMDEGTLNLVFLEETRDRCIRCGACVRACPMGIDIRQGFQIECINCGRCIDACRGGMEQRGTNDGLIAYRFGERGERQLRVGTKTVILSLLVCVLSAMLAWGIHVRSDAAFAVQRLATAESRKLTDGSQVQPWRAIIGNRSQTPAVYALDVAPQPGVKIELLGPISAIRIAPNENRQVSFFIRFSTAAPVHLPFELRLLRAGVAVATTQVTP